MPRIKKCRRVSASRAIPEGSGTAALKTQPGVDVMAARAFAGIGLSGGGVEVIAAHAEEAGFSTGMLEERVIATVVEDPQAQKKSRDEQAVNDCGGGEIHAAAKTDWLSAQTDL